MSKLNKSLQKRVINKLVSTYMSPIKDASSDSKLKFTFITDDEQMFTVSSDEIIENHGNFICDFIDSLPDQPLEVIINDGIKEIGYTYINNKDTGWL